MVLKLQALFVEERKEVYEYMGKMQEHGEI